MLPEIEIDELVSDFEEVTEPSKTYKIDLEKKQITGFCDGLEAINQAIYKMIETERFQYFIYSWNYGTEKERLFGQPIPYVFSELKRVITEALLQDDRIQKVEVLDIRKGTGSGKSRRAVSMTLRVTTVEGVLEVTREVTV